MSTEEKKDCYTEYTEISRLKRKVNALLEINEKLRRENRTPENGANVMDAVMCVLIKLKREHRWMESSYQTSLTKEFFRIEKTELEESIEELNLGVPVTDVIRWMLNLGIMYGAEGRHVFKIMVQKRQYKVYMIRKTAIEIITEAGRGVNGR